MADVAEQATEVVAEVVEEVAEEAAQVAEVVRGITSRDINLVFFGSCVGVIGGFAIGAWWMSSRMKLKYEKLVAEEIDQVREHFRRKEVARQERIRPLEDVVEELGYTPPVPTQGGLSGTPPKVPRESPVVRVDVPPPAPPPGVVVRNVFKEADTQFQWDYAEEVRNRDPRVPFVIHIDEHKANEVDHEQVTWTYYEGDDVLCNEQDQAQDQDETVGVGNIGRFGHGSTDANVVYVRNIEAKMDFEIIRMPGTFAHFVHGLDDSEHNDDMRHSADEHRGRGRQLFDDE